jgi:hypothetical protein
MYEQLGPGQLFCKTGHTKGISTGKILPMKAEKFSMVQHSLMRVLGLHIQLFRSKRNKVLAITRVARFFLVHDTKAGKMYQMNTKCTKWS